VRGEDPGGRQGWHTMIARAELPPIWSQDVNLPRPPRLEVDTRVDVCVIGAGIAGLSVAKLLSADHAVAVLDARGPGAGETGRTTAHLTHALDDRYARLIQLHGEEHARLAAESHSAAIARIEALVQSFDQDCELERVDGFLFAPRGSDGTQLERELEAAHRVGLSEVEWVARAPLDSFDTGRCLRFPHQAQIHPLKYVSALVSALERAGVRIHGDTRATQVEGGSPARVLTQSGAVVTADAVVVATNTPMNERVTIHTKQGAYRTYVIAAAIPNGSVPRALYWDTAQRADEEGEQGAPYHYVRVAHAASGEVLIVGGEDHKTGQALDEPDRFVRLEAWARERFPTMREVVAGWSGQVLEPVDALNFIGPDPTGQQNVFIVTGDSGNGMTGGMVAGILLDDLIRGVQNPWAPIYDPARVTVRSLPRFAKENLDAATHLVGDRVKPAEVSSLASIEPGHGALVRSGREKVAVYRDHHGDFHACSAVCTHLGCLVHWNRSTRTWDCPCHGSRFSPHGTVVNGPAVQDLAPAELPFTRVPNRG
jgi:glycine/D-amino acid oxidase-like deaminating enzyme/nitrite reductase/ring-hydroxylating ferredoxin subunit